MVSRPEDRSERFKERLNWLLEQKDIRQVDLAKHLQVTKTTVSRYCAGRIPDAETLDRIARYLGVSVDYLLGRTDDPHGSGATSGDNVLVVVADEPIRDLVYFLRGHQLTDEDVEAVKDLLEARRIRRQREERQNDQS